MKPFQKQTNARLHAVQALYAFDVNPDADTRLIYQFLHHEVGQSVVQEDEDGRETEVALDDFDAALFTQLVKTAQEEQFTTMLNAALSNHWHKNYIDPILKAILRTGLAEAWLHPETDAAILINEYTDLAHAFYDGPEVGLVNAVLHKAIEQMRS